ncbi:Mite allergen Der p 7 [Dermatophagoides pteronyssinus]|uniref:Mite allergen Der p 7 n=1 Tax=Dermatophagoides pteronyssinus TaxID=6956 RepID=A0ABQ8JQ64_DERPT|nr:Mite allergen Der p 7 [Dermatophagoides pteronyssinus]
MMKLLLIAAAAFVAVSADPIHYDKITEEINKAVDEAVAAIEKSETFDPMKVPDHSDKFERHIGIIDLKGELDMRNIQVRGLKQMKREVRQFANVVNHIGGLSILDPIFAVLSDVLTAIFQDTVRAEMTKVLAPAFKKELERNNQ